MARFKPYSIICPPYDITSGGIRVMYALRSWLEIKGQVVFINAKFSDNNFIAVYPEIYYGNEAQAKTVVRYILNKPGVMMSYGRPGPSTKEIKETSDHIFVFSRIFDTFGVNESHILFLPILNLHLFRDYKKKRTKTCVFIGKGKDLGLHPKDSILIDRKFAVDQGALADLLNDCQVMYSYDPVSAMHEIARLCGCRVVLLNSDREYLKDYEPGLNGISFGLEQNVPLDVKGFRLHYMHLRKLFNKKIDFFIEVTQK